MLNLLRPVTGPGLSAALGMLLLSAAPAQAQQAPQLEGYRVALFSAASNPGYAEDIQANIMVGSRGVGGVYQQLVLDPDGAVVGFLENPLPSRVAYEIQRVDIFDVAIDVPRVDDLEPYDALLIYNDIQFVSPAAVGDLAAAAVELGKAVILTGGALDANLHLAGRFESQAYAPTSNYGTLSSPGNNLAILPVDVGVTWTSNTDDNVITGPNIGSQVDYGTQQLGSVEARVLGGTGSRHLTGLIPRAQTYQVHRWSNSEPANIFLPPVIQGQGATSLANWNPVSDAVDPAGHVRQSSGGRLLANVILETILLSRPEPVADDYTRPQGTCFRFVESSVPEFADFTEGLDVVGFQQSLNSCLDNEDNDQDGLTDEDDPDCTDFPMVAQPEPFLGTDQLAAELLDAGLNWPGAPAFFFTTCDYNTVEIGGTPFGSRVRCQTDQDCIDVIGDETAFCEVIQNRSIEQDLNCNGLDVSLRRPTDGEFFETRFDPLGDDVDPDCQNNINPETGAPWDNADVYFDYFSFECEYYTGDMDPDGDGLSFGTVTLQLTEDPQTWETVQLACDNCPEFFNPNQFDWDEDGVGDLCDNCPYVFQDPQAPGMREDTDGDGFGNACDNCFRVFNPDQADDDNDGYGNACDNCPDDFNNVCGLSQAFPDFLQQEDIDVDTVGNTCDNCFAPDLDEPNPYNWKNDPESSFFQLPPTFDEPNPSQADTDRDGWGDACDVCPNIIDRDQPDEDLDGVGDACDNCPDLVTTVRADSDQDGRGDACDNCDDVKNLDQFDLDFDGVGDACDNCLTVSNDDQFDSDKDGAGDFCDNCQFEPNPTQGDADIDGFGDACDNCPLVPQNNQDDRDGDGFGDACDFCIDEETETNIDSDGDGWGDQCDNCPTVPNFQQTDSDGDSLGDACDLVAIRGGGELTQIVGPNASCSTSGSGAGVAWLLGAFALVGLRRRRIA